MKAIFAFLMDRAVPITISIVALAFAILSLIASWRQLDLAKKANSWSYYSYEATLVQTRLSLMQLCAQDLVSVYFSLPICIVFDFD
jgi:hypothetical protein